MYKYVSKIDNVKNLKNVNIYMTDNNSVSMALTGELEARKPTQALYIKDGNVLALNIFERIENADKVYKLYNYSTKIQNNNVSEYIKKVDIAEKSIQYDLGKITVDKKIVFEKETSILQVKYIIQNNSDSKTEFFAFPYLTFRDFKNMKNEKTLKFNQRKLDKGVIINLSVTSNTNFIIKSQESKYILEPQNICNIKHTSTDAKLKNTECYEDVFKPGEFKIQIKKGEIKEFSIYMATKDFELEEINQKDLFMESKVNLQKAVKSIEKEFIELQDLAKGLEICNLNGKIISRLPYRKDALDVGIQADSIRIDEVLNSIKEVTNSVKSIEGQYLSLNKVKLAKITLIKIRRYIKEIEALKLDNICILKELTLLKLWFVESINRLYAKDSEIGVFVPQIKEIIISTINSENKEIIFEDLECVCLIYNALKIYENMVNSGVGEEIIAYNTYKKIEDLLENSFWVEEKNILKYNLREQTDYANISMLYSISLSYPCIIGNMKMKILDTIFKELYTPYGLREFSAKSEKYDGNIYPKYMAHFLKANFRQNGVTRASQKLAYNLVKELLQDVSKYENCGIKEIYSDKGINIDTDGYDVLTNSEMIRLYNMLI